MDPETFEVLGQWELDRGPQYLAYDFWWHLGYDTMVTSEWGTPQMVENGLNPEILLKGGYGHSIHFWDLRRRRHQQALDLGSENQITLELRPAHEPSAPMALLGVVVFIEGSFGFHLALAPRGRQNGNWSIRRSSRSRRSRPIPTNCHPSLKGSKPFPPGHRYRPLRGRSLPLRIVLGDR